MCCRIVCCLQLALTNSSVDQHDSGGVTAPTTPQPTLFSVLHACGPPQHELCQHLCVTVRVQRTQLADGVIMCSSYSCVCVVQLRVVAEGLAWTNKYFEHVVVHVTEVSVRRDGASDHIE